VRGSDWAGLDSFFFAMQDISVHGRSHRALRWTLGIVLVLTLGVGLALTAQGLGLWERAPGPHVKDLAADEQEIAWIDPATNTDVWAQLTAGLARLEADWPSLEGTRGQLKVDLGHEPGGAFPQRTADVAEVALYFAEAPRQKLWLRWYKISGDNPTDMWIDKLRARARPPVAIVGGGSSDRAFRLANLLKAAANVGWHGKPPLMLITMATAEAERPVRGDGQQLMSIYAYRSFRFCFTNGAMVRAVLGFLHENPQVWVEPAALPSALATAGAITCGDAWSALGFLQAARHLGPKLYAVSWQDDSYARDIEHLFRTDCRTWHPFASQVDLGILPYSVGDTFQPNSAETTSVDLFLSQNPPPPRSVLVLPAAAQRMRRYLGFLCLQDQRLARNLVVVNGDAISFHNVYRDRDFAWNVLDLPVPVVFFSHRNPVDTNAALNWSFSWIRDEQKHRSTTGTHDLLLYRDIIESMLYAAFEDGRLLGDADRVGERLRHTRWRAAPADASPSDRLYNRTENDLVNPRASGPELFDANGNRRPGTGEHIVWLRPNFHDNRLLALQPCTISIWRYHAPPASAAWDEIDSHSPPYNQARSPDE
jgi:hypothetical protein